MKNLKKVLALVLALMMTLSLMATASAADFTDADEIQYKEAVEVMTALKVLEGYPNGAFGAKDPLVRAAAAKIVAYIMEGGMKGVEDAASVLDNPFTDIPTGASWNWLLVSAKYLANEGMLLGYGDGRFGTNDPLTAAAFGKLVLLAAGIGTAKDYVGDATQSFETKVMVALKANGLLDGLKETITAKTVLNREQACQIAFNAMKYDPTPDTYMVYSDEDSSGDYSDGDIILKKTTDASEAALLVKQLGAGYDYVPLPATGNLLAEKFGVTKGAVTTTDAFGRAANVWEKGGVALVTYVTAAPVLTYTSATQATAVTADLKGYYIEADAVPGKITAVENPGSTQTLTNGKVVDGVAADITVATSSTLAAQIALLTGNNTVVEVYANAKKEIVKVVVTNTYVDTVATYVDAVAATETPAYITLTGTGATKHFSAEGFTKADATNNTVVLYTKANNVLKTVVKAPYVDGKVATYTNYLGTFVYSVAGGNYIAGADVTDTTLKGKLGATTDSRFYLGANNTIVKIGNVDGTVVAPSTDYAYINDVKVAVKTTTGTGFEAASTVAVTAAVQVVLFDGTVTAYDLPVVKNGATPIMSGASTLVAANHYYVAVGTGYVDLGVWATSDDATASAFTTALKTTDGTKIVGKVYGYTVKDNAIALETVAGISGSETTAGAVLATTPTADIKNTHLTATVNTNKTVMLTSNTKFVYFKTVDGKLTATTVTGVKNLSADVVAGEVVGVIVGVAPVKNVAGSVTGRNYTAEYVLVNPTTMPGAASDVDYAFVYHNLYSVTDKIDAATKKPILAYTAMNAKGEVITLYSVNELGYSLLYKYNSEKVIGDPVGTNVVYGTYAKMSDEMIKVTEANTTVHYYNVNADTQTAIVYTGATLVDGCSVAVVYNAQNMATAIFVWYPAA